MLARTPISDLYLSADALLVTELEREKLIEVRNDLDCGLLPYSESNQLRWFEECGSKPSRFNMLRWFGSSECGTVACIGGHMEARGAWTRSGQLAKTGTLRRLFYPEVCVKFEDLTIRQAVRACDFFLLGWGDNCWPKAMTDDAVEAI